MDQTIIKATLYCINGSSASDKLLQNAMLNEEHAKPLEVFPVLAIANEPNAVLVANVISLKDMK